VKNKLIYERGTGPSNQMECKQKKLQQKDNLNKPWKAPSMSEAAEVSVLLGVGDTTELETLLLTQFAR
jgi:hypothetical protein